MIWVLIMLKYHRGQCHEYYKFNGCLDRYVSTFPRNPKEAQATMRKGRRCSSSKAFLEPIRHRSNLKVTKYSTVNKILINPDTKTAYGVEFTKHNKRIQVLALREVILSAGVYRIGTIVDGIWNWTKKAFIRTASPVSAVSYMAGRGPLTLPGGAVGLAFARSSLASDDHSATRPDIELVMGGGSLAGDLLGILRSLLGVTDQWYWKVYGSLPLNVRQNSFSINPVLIRPRSVGRLKLRTANFTDPPIIHMNYFHDPKDLKALVHGIRLTQQVIGTSAFQRYATRLHTTPFPGCEKLQFDSDQYWECAIEQTSITLDHQVGTCKMAAVDDKTGVVSPRLLVHNIRGLRVADASIMPRIPAAHTHAPVVMIAEKAADIIKEDWGMRSNSIYD
ncbi:hypothetical protein ACJJTC_010119 [Scirpophaga incertulas]